MTSHWFLIYAHHSTRSIGWHPGLVLFVLMLSSSVVGADGLWHQKLEGLPQVQKSVEEDWLVVPTIGQPLCFEQNTPTS